MLPSLPILTTAQVNTFEAHFFGQDTEKTWTTIQQVGTSLGQAILEDYSTWRTLSRNPHILILCGSGHNAADALLAAHSILEARPRGRAVIIWGINPTSERLLPSRALNLLKATGRILTEITLNTTCSPEAALKKALSFTPHNTFDLTLDGFFGLNFKPPLPPSIATLLDLINDQPAFGLRTAIDIPSGLAEIPYPTAFKAHFTYQTGIPKTLCLNRTQAPYLGRVRVLDLGFFKGSEAASFPLFTNPERVLLPAALQTLGSLRPAAVHKYKQGTVALVAGSAEYPGALLLAAQGALRSGVGLVRAFAPKSLIPSFAATCPEVIWTPQPEASNGGIDAPALLEALESIKNLSALVIGPGLGSSPATHTCLKTLAEALPCPIVFDADALSENLTAALLSRKSKGYISILTPHAGEFERLTSITPNTLANDQLLAFASTTGAILCLKGYLPRITDGHTLYHVLAGGPILARAGSGDVLAGLIGGALAEAPLRSTFATTALCVLWHALAADVWARHTGERSTHTSELLRYLPHVLRSYTADV